MNRGDSETILGIAKKYGHGLVEKLEDADLAVINTCAVKGVTYRKMLWRLRELKKSGKKIVVAGCLPLIDGTAIEKLGLRDSSISCREIWRFHQVFGDGASPETRLEDKLDAPRFRLSDVSAIIPIAEGCTFRCTYCSVKLARGDLKSFDEAKILKRVEEAVSQGYKEILLTAQDTAAYGADCGRNLPDLIKKIASIQGEFRVRVGMMNPKNALEIIDELPEAFSDEKIYKFLHLPVQSGDDEILKKMGRGYTAGDFCEIVEKFYKNFPELYLCTDIIVGFPGEGEEEFMRTCALIEKIMPDKTNVSKFSSMPNTIASTFKQVDGREIAKRSRTLSAICRRIGLEKNQRLVGRKVAGFITEEGEKGGKILRAANYKPVVVEEGKLGDYIHAKITEAFPTYLKGVKI